MKVFLWVAPVVLENGNLKFKLPGDVPWPGPKLDEYKKGHFGDGQYIKNPDRMKKAGWRLRGDVPDDLFLQFGRLSKDKYVEESVYRFASDYGPLWVCSSHPSCFYSPEEDAELIGKKPAPIMLRQAQGQAQITVKDKARLKISKIDIDFPGLADVARGAVEEHNRERSFTACEWEGIESVSQWLERARIVENMLKAIKKIKDGVCSKDERNLLFSYLNSFNNASFGPSLFLEWDEKEKWPKIEYRPGHGFIRSVMLQLTRYAAGSPGFYTCSRCGEVYLRTKKAPKPGQHNFCPKHEESGPVWASRRKRPS
jgi:hypothetical protein